MQRTQKYLRDFYTTRMLPTERLNVSTMFHFSDARLSILDFTAQWSLYVPPVVTVCTTSGHYVPPVVTICTTSGHCMYHQWSLYVPPMVTTRTASGHYMYHHWSLYVPPVVTVCTANGHYMYGQWSLHVDVPPV